MSRPCKTTFAGDPNIYEHIPEVMATLRADIAPLKLRLLVSF